MAVDYGAQGLRVNALCPGPMLSPRIRGYLESGKFNGKAIERQVPLGCWAECQELANVAVFLISHAGSDVHGATIVSDGRLAIQYPANADSDRMSRNSPEWEEICGT
jgi:NAD(P)-dependent dehydrogenase (short-subunit alcohol dehydrogenase family)